MVDAAWSFFARTIRSVDSLKRYQGLKAALRMATNQVDLHRLRSSHKAGKLSHLWGPSRASDGRRQLILASH